MIQNMNIDTALLGCLSNRQRSEDGEEVAGQFICPPDFPAFQGHFPGNPLLPAFVQMAMVRILVQQEVGKVLLPRSTGRVKFAGMVKPDEVVQANVQVKQNETDWSVKFSLTKEDEQVASGEIIFSEKGKVQSAK